MKKAKLRKSVVFMPPVNEVINLDDDIKIADPGTEVFILERRPPAALVLHNDLSKWIHEQDLEVG